MQLDQILSAAVAAVNDVQQIPSPDVPQYSPTPPAAAAHDSQQSKYLTHEIKHELPELETSTPVPVVLEQKPIISSNESIQKGVCVEGKNAYNVYSAALQDTQVGDGLGDISFFSMDDDNLVITSQQALEMFEPKPEDLTKRSVTSYQVISNIENPPEINTPPMPLAENLPKQNEVSARNHIPDRVEERHHSAVPIQELPAKDGAVGEVSLGGDMLENFPVFLENEIPLASGVQVTEVTEEVPVISSEVEVLTSLEAPQYTSLAPVSAHTENPLTCVTDVVQSLPGSTLDATVDANGRFVVQVVGPGMNMTVQNQYIGREEEVISEPQIMHQMTSQAPNTQISNALSSTGPYTTYDEYSTYIANAPYSSDEHINREKNVCSDKHMKGTSQSSARSREQEDPSAESHTNVLVALRNSIYRSRAKKRKAEDNCRAAKTPVKKRPADILKELHMDYEYQDSRQLSRERNMYEGRRYRRPLTPENREYTYPVYQREPARSPDRSGAKHSQGGYGSSSNMMVLRPEELQAALQRRGRPGSSSPLVVMRPEDLHAEGGDGNNDPLQVQLVYLVYPMDGPEHSGSQNKRAPSDMINYNRPSVFPRDMPQIALQPPTAVNKQVPWLLDDAPNIHPSGRILDDASHSESDSFKNKPVQNWTYTDVIYFMFDAIRELNIKDQDLIISKLSGMTGKDLCNMTVEDFRKFLPKTGDIMHRYFFSKLHEERRQVASAVASSQQECHMNRLSSLETPFDFVNSPSNPFYQPSHHPPTHLSSRQQPPSVLMREPSGGGIDASAPYELRYETVDARAISGYDEDTRRLLSGTLPSASGKSFDLLHAPSPAIPFDIDDNISDPDQSSNEEEVKPEPPKKRGPGRPRKPENELKKKKKKTGRLWEFIRNLLLDPETCPSLVKWENPEEGIFRFVQAEKVAQRWGERKQNKDMNYEKLSRAMRYYYKGGVFEAVIGRRLVYKFGKNAKNWRPSNPNFANHLPYSQSSSHQV